MLKCIIVEDEKQIRNGLTNYFDWEELGFNIVGAAENGKEAYELIKKFEPHLVITDIRMPIMDGLELIEQSVAIFKNIKFIVLSGYNDFTYAQKSLQFGVSDYLLKPLNFEELKHSIERISVNLYEETKINSLLNKGVTLLKDDFIKNVVKGVLNQKLSISNKAKELDFDINEFVFYIMRTAVKVEIEGYKESPLSLKNIISNLINDVVSKYGESYIFEEYKHQFTIILYIPKKKISNANSVIDEIIEHITKYLENYLNTKIYIGLGGSFADIYGAKELYLKSGIDLNGKLLVDTMESKSQLNITEAAMRAIKKTELKDVNLDNIAKLIFVSPYYLSRVFRQETGENFINYVTKLRVEKAKELITNFDLCCDQITDIIGYNNTKYFLKIFKEYTGLTPKEFKKINSLSMSLDSHNAK